MQPTAVERAVWIAAPREQVWDILTDPQHMEQWWGDQWQFSSRGVGGTITFGHGDDAYYATITSFDAPNRFVFEWHGNAEFPPMTTEFVLTEENGGTRVNVRDAGFEKLSAEVRQQRIDQTGSGYEIVLAELKKRVETLPG